VITECNKI